MSWLKRLTSPLLKVSISSYSQPKRGLFRSDWKTRCSSSSEKLKIFSETKIAMAMFTETSSFSASEISCLTFAYRFVDVGEVLQTVRVELLVVCSLQVVERGALEEGRVDYLVSDAHLVCVVERGDLGFERPQQFERFDESVSCGEHQGLVSREYLVASEQQPRLGVFYELFDSREEGQLVLQRCVKRVYWRCGRLRGWPG